MNKTEAFIKILVPILSAIFSALLVWYVTSDWEPKAREHGWVPIIEWREEAKNNGWILEENCPANPVKIKIIGPGNKSTIYYKESLGIYSIKNDFIVESNKSIKGITSDHIGFVLYSSSSKGYRVVFPSSLANDSGKNIRTHNFNLPFTPKNNEEMNIWSIYVDDKNDISSVYSDFSQIEASKYVLSLSPQISVILEK